MKRMVCLLLITCVLLSGCSVFGERVKGPVTFYYVHRDYSQEMNSVIASEIREASGHRDDLSYLLALYSMGPSDENLVSPFPRNTRIIPTEHSDHGIVLSVSETADILTDAEFTLASACLSLTCMELTTAEQITVVCEDRSITIRQDNLLLSGNISQQLTEE